MYDGLRTAQIFLGDTDYIGLTSIAKKAELWYNNIKYYFLLGDQMNYSLNVGEWNSVFAVPSGVVDKYIKLAGGNSLKLLLFLLRHGGQEFSDAQLKEALGFRREGELEDAAQFWIQRGILRADGGLLTAAADDAPLQETLPEAAIQQDKPLQPLNTSASVRAASDNGAVIYTASDIAQRINTDPAIKYLFSEAQTLYGRLLKQPESRMILMLVDHYGLPAMVSALLLKYCFMIGKTSTGYIQSVAQTWADDGISTAAEADALLSKLEKRFAIEEKLREAMELKTKFSQKQLNFIKTWAEDWGFSLDMILMAHEITLDNTGSMSFSYTNKILENWKSAGVYTKQAAEQERAAHKPAKSAQKAQSENSSIDVGGIMQDVLQKYRS